VVVTFHSRQSETWGVTDGSKAEVESYFQGISLKARQLIELPKTWKRWATADRELIGNWVFGRAKQHQWDAALQLYHAVGVERLVRNSPWKGRPHARYYDTIKWLYGWDVNNCLQQG
jgi:salicylate hydroxylase